MALPDDEPTVARAAAAGGREKRAYVRRIFTEIAPRYDLLNHLLSFNIDRRWRRRALAALEWTRRPDGRYLDLCAGTLDVSAALTNERAFTGHVVAADFAEPMLRSGLGKVSRAKVSTVAADALELPLASASFDGGLAAFGIRNLTGLEEGFAEILRVLKPGGRFVILDFTTPRSPLIRAGYHLYFHRVLPLAGRIVSGHPTAYRYLPESVAHFPDETALAARMRAAGFVDVSFKRLSLGIAAIHVGVKPPAASRGGPRDAAHAVAAA